MAKTFKESLVKDRHINTRMRIVDFQPGNGYEYQVLICTIPNATDPDQDANVIIRLDGRGSNEHSAMTLENTSTLHWTYVWEKMGSDEMDAKVMTRLICGLLDIEELDTNE